MGTKKELTPAEKEKLERLLEQNSKEKHRLRDRIETFRASFAGRALAVTRALARGITPAVESMLADHEDSVRTARADNTLLTKLEADHDVLYAKRYHTR